MLEKLILTKTKAVKDLYSENHETLKKVTKEDINRWKVLPDAYIERITILKMSVLPKAIYTFNTIFNQIPMPFLAKLEKPILKFIWMYQDPE